MRAPLRHDVAIYAPFASVFYDADADRGGGGAERQTWLLARSLARRGLRVSHIIYPVQRPAIDPDLPITLVQRPKPDEHGHVRAFAAEGSAVWRSLQEADAAVHVFRGAQGAVGIAGAWSRLHRRKLIFAGASNFDFTDGAFPSRRDPRAVFFRAGLRMADAVVAQSADQLELARKRVPKLRELEEIPSFVEPAPEANGGGEAFLWVSRLSTYKRPLLYADLAAAVPEARFWMIATKTTEPEYEPTLAELRRRADELDNFELLPQCRHPELQALIGRAVAMVNTSEFEGMPNTWLEGWSRGVPALTLSFDPDSRISEHGLGLSAEGSWDGFVGAARRLWEGRSDRAGYGPAVRGHVADVHGTRVEERWAALVERLS